jgi:hypothetical protein
MGVFLKTFEILPWLSGHNFTITQKITAGHWWLMTVITATQETDQEDRGSKKIVRETLSLNNPSQKKGW